MRSKKTRILSLVLAMIMAAGCLCIPAMAEGELTAFTWSMDPTSMSSITDNGSSTAYSLSASSVTLADVSTDAYSGKAISIAKGQYTINDKNAVLDDYPAFELSGDFYFESFPSGNYISGGVTYSTDPTDANFYSQSVIAWTRATAADGSGTSFEGIRMDYEGNLYSGNGATTALDVKLEEDTWYNIKLVFSVTDRVCEVIVDGVTVTYIALGNNYDSKTIRFYDKRFNYDTYIKNLKVTTYTEEYKIGGMAEESADFISYQTTIVEDGSYDMRIMAGLDSLNYKNFGYDVCVITKDASGNPVTNEYSATGYEAYSSIYGGNTEYSIKDNFGYEYACLVTLTNLDATSSYTELVIRPYTMGIDGNKKYGQATILQYTGVGESGYPEFLLTDNQVVSVFVSDDSYTRNGLYVTTNYGTETTMLIKDSGSNYDRSAYIKFPISEEMKNSYIAGVSSINLSLYVASARTRSEAETAAGGYKMEIYSVADNTWSEDTLTCNNAPAKGDAVASFLVNGTGKYDVDVTDAVGAAIAAGNSEISFCLRDAEGYGDGSTEIRTKENANDLDAPKLTLQSSFLPYQLNLEKYKNKGYEPWGYAQKLVDEWFTTDRAKAYATTYDAFNVGNMTGGSKTSITSANGAHTVPIQGSSSSPNPSFKSLYARTIDSLEANGYTPAEGDKVSQYDVYGGITNSGLTGATATGYFHVDTLSDGRKYLIDPLGNPFFVTAFNTINAGSTAAQRAYVTDTLGKTTEEYWADMTADLRAIGVNAATGSFDSITNQGDNSMSGVVGITGISGYMSSMSLGTSTGGQSSFMYNDTMNVFDPDFITYTDARNKVTLEKYKNNPYVIGYTSDNELPRRADMLDAYLTLDPSVIYNAFSYATAWTWFIEKTGKTLPSLSDITDEMREEFKAFVFSALFKTVSGQVAKYDVNHMYIGTRANGTNRNSEGYLRAAGAYCGMLTINMYDGLEPSGDIIEAIYKYSGKPFIVTEFYAKAQDAYGLNGDLLANQQNAGFLVPTQEDRAVYYQNYTLLLLESKYCVGWIWYRFQDNDQSLYKIVTEDGQTFENLRTWVRGDRYEIKSFIREGCVDAGTSSANLVTLDLPTAIGSTSDSVAVSLSYTDASGTLVSTTGTLTWTYVGETDTSNLGSNKGIVDNQMNIYQPLAEAITLIGNNIFSLIEYFDNTVNAGE